MPKILAQNKGILLFLVVSTIVMVIILGAVMIGIITSQGRLTSHQISRIQAYYASMAGVNLAYERLRNGNDANWPRPAANTCYMRTICRSAALPDCGAAGVIVDDKFPVSINHINIFVASNGAICNPPAPHPALPACAPSAGLFCISAFTDYTYTP